MNLRKGSTDNQNQRKDKKARLLHKRRKILTSSQYHNCLKELQKLWLEESLEIRLNLK